MGLLFAALLCLWLIDALGPLVLFGSWLIALASLALLARGPAPLRNAAQRALAVLVCFVLLALVGTGVTLARGGVVLAVTPEFDPTTIALSLGIVASWIAAAVLVATYDIALGRWLGPSAAAWAAVAGVLFVFSELSRAHLVRSGFTLGGNALGYALGIAGILVLVALGRIGFSRSAA